MISKNTVKAAGRALDMFEAFGACGRPLTLSELAREIGVPASSCFSLIQTFLARGYLYSGARRAYYPTRLMLETARAIAANDPLSEGVTEAVARLRDATGETVIAGKLEGREVIYLDVADSPHTVRYTTAIGARKPLHSSAMGKALLGRMDEAALAALLDELPLARITPKTLTSRPALEAEIAAGRRRGWYMTRGENVVDVMAVAATVVLHEEPVGITVAGPVHRMQAKYAAHAAALLAACERLERG